MTKLSRKTRDRIRSTVLAFGKPEVSVIATPYKVGSTTMFDRLCEPFMYAGGHAQLVDSSPPRVLHFSIKMHTGERRLAELERAIEQPFTRIITTIRKQDDIYVAAYFQNITDAAYPYRFGAATDVLRAAPEELVEHFLNFSWDKYQNLSIRANADEIACFTGINYLDHIDPKRGFEFRLFNSTTQKRPPLQIAVASMQVLREAATFRRFLEEMRLPLTPFVGRIYSIKANTADDKWYKDKYKQVRAILKTDRRFIERAAHWCRDLPGG